MGVAERMAVSDVDMGPLVTPAAGDFLTDVVVGEGGVDGRYAGRPFGRILEIGGLAAVLIELPFLGAHRHEGLLPGFHVLATVGIAAGGTGLICHFFHMLHKETGPEHQRRCRSNSA